jgi:16S rRNA (guanine527-N7)-methyltransferase
VSVADDGELSDPLVGDPRVAEFFRSAWPAVSAFDGLLRREGVLRGLLGPREVARLWERHLLNSATVAQFLPTSGCVIDLGSGAGLPGVVVAAMRPDLEVVLLEPMLRRTDWLTEVVSTLGLDNARVVRGRAEDVVGQLEADAVTCRAVASLDKLMTWSAPLLRRGGALVALKGARADTEIAEAAGAAKRLGFGRAELRLATSIDGIEPTRVVRAVWEGARVR